MFNNFGHSRVYLCAMEKDVYLWILVDGIVRTEITSLIYALSSRRELHAVCLHYDFIIPADIGRRQSGQLVSSSSSSSFSSAASKEKRQSMLATHKRAQLCAKLMSVSHRLIYSVYQ